MNRKIGSLTLTLSLFVAAACYSQATNGLEQITVHAEPAGGVVQMLHCENGFGGGNVAASIGPDGILLVDNMYKAITPKLVDAVKKNNNGAIRFVINSHFHADHIEGNSVLSRSSVIIAQENLLKRFRNKPGWATAEAFPQVVFSDRLTLNFNGEDIRIFHLPNGHTDCDAMVYFTKSGVIHLGDMYFKGMFPAVYKEGGGDVLQLIRNLEQVLTEIPDTVKVIPGHGELATKADLQYYVNMLKKTTSIVQAGIKAGKSVKQLQEEKVFTEYDALGSGGAQTTDQYLAMLYKLLSA